MSNFYKNLNVMVTGAGGFIASHLVEELVRLGASVRAFVRYNSRGDPGLLKLLPKPIINQVDIRAGDLRDRDALQQVMEGVSHVFHLGALIAIPYSYKHPVEVVESNVLGTLNVLMAGRECGIKRIVHTSTSEVYGTAMQVPIAETHPLQGQSPYSASKIGADKLVESFFRSFDLPVVTIRPFNTYGPRQSARAIIPTIIVQLLAGHEIHLGNLSARRDMTYVSDTVNGFLGIGQVPEIEGETFNIGTGMEISVEALVELISELMGVEADIIIDEVRLRPEKSEVERLVADNRLAREHLGWEPMTGLKEGLEQTIDWIRSHMDLYQPNMYQL